MVISQEVPEVCLKLKWKGLQAVCSLDVKCRKLLKDWEELEKKVRTINNVYTYIGRSPNRQMLTCSE